MPPRSPISRRRFVGAGAALLAAAASLPQPAPIEGATTARFAYVGCYTRNAPGGTSGRPAPVAPRGIGVLRVTPETGALTPVQTVPSNNPSFLALAPNGRHLYAINEIDDYGGRTTGSIEAYAIDGAAGTLSLLNREDVGAPIPAHLAVHPSGSHVVVANYTGGSYTVLPLQPDGRLSPVSDTYLNRGSGPRTDRQSSPHPHVVVFDPAGRYLAGADLGIDRVQIFRLDTGAGRLSLVNEAALAPGAGPRHLAFHPNGRYVYVINELDSTITAFTYEAADGRVGPQLQTIATVPADFPAERSTAEIAVHPSGRFLYGSNRKLAEHPLADAIVAFSIDQASGRLALIGHYTQGIAFPRSFGLEPVGEWLYACNQKGDTIAQFGVDPASGALAATGRVVEWPTPACIVFAAAAAAPVAQPGPSDRPFADPAFRARWASSDEGATGRPYLFGPAPFSDGLTEDYAEAPGGRRLVQYFDKARMELGRPGEPVTTGLLTVELISGRLQRGDATFESRQPARQAVAGDPDNPFPRYADLESLRASAADRRGQVADRRLAADGSSGTEPSAAGDAAALVTAFDRETGHNLPRAFADFRAAPSFGGLPTIGLAITEPVWVEVRVAGRPRRVLLQAFERRVLTYTPDLPEGQRVEYGNIGRHYYAWRYGT